MRHRTTENSLSLLGGAVLGAVAMYLLDPEAGRRRREHLGEAVGDMSRHTGDALGSAWHAVSEGTRSASSALAQKAGDLELGRRASGWGDHLTGLGHNLMRRARNVGHGISNTAGDWSDRARDAGGRAYDSVRHPGSWFEEEEESHAGEYAAYTAGGIAALALGAGLMFLLDPQRGRARRSLVQNKVTSIVNRTGRTFRGIGKDLRNRAQGVAAETRGRFYQQGDSVSADQLLQRVRSELGHVVSHSGEIQVMTDNSGAVTLHGRILASEVDKMLSTVKAIPGVEEVVNLLSVQDTMQGMQSPSATGQVPQM